MDWTNSSIEWPHSLNLIGATSTMSPFLCKSRNDDHQISYICQGTVLILHSVAYLLLVLWFEVNYVTLVSVLRMVSIAEVSVSINIGRNLKQVISFKMVLLFTNILYISFQRSLGY